MQMLVNKMATLSIHKGGELVGQHELHAVLPTPTS